MLSYRWSNVIPGFNMPVDVSVADGKTIRISPTEVWQTMPMTAGTGAELNVALQYYVTTSRGER